MTLAELQKILRKTDPAAVLVSPRILERVIREECRLPSLVWSLPHNKSFVCDRQVLFRHAEQADLELETDQLLPDTVILLTRPDAEELSNLERKHVLLKYWRRLFHSRVHLAFGVLPELGPLADDGLRERLACIGQTQFEEISQVLIEDRFLPAEADARHTYIEFAATYLELLYFAPGLLPNTFPGIKDSAAIERYLGRDVDASGLFASTRLQGAPDPSSIREVRTDESQEAFWTLVRCAQAATLEDNRVKSAILRMKASRIAPAALSLPTRQEAESDITVVANRLASALQLDEREKEDWTRQMILLLDKADQGVLPVEQRLLDDFQQVCRDHERDIYTLDPLEYVVSWGRRPLKRPLPSQKLVRIVRHMARAVGRLDEVRLSDTDRGRLSRLMNHALANLTHQLHSRLRPVLTTAMEDVGLKPTDPVERVAFDKMVAELLDRITNYGFLTFGELRDTISRNQLKCPDLTEPEDFLRGDPLLRLDTRLASLLDGVYRRGEFYVRWLERGTSLLFGTLSGRIFTRFLLMPLVLAWVAVYLLGFMLSMVPASWSQRLHWTAGVMMGPVHEWAEQEKRKQSLEQAQAALREESSHPTEPQTPAQPAEESLEGAKQPPPTPEPNQTEQARLSTSSAHGPSHWGWHVGLVLASATFTLALLENERFRRRCLIAALATAQGIRRLVWDVPLAMVPLETIQRAIAGWPFQLFYWAVFKPLIVLAILAWFFPLWFTRWYIVFAAYVLAALLVNSRFGKTSSEAIRDALMNVALLIRSGLLPGLVRLIVQVFKQVVELIELTFYRIDEWLRFSSGDGTISLVIRTVLGIIWQPVSVVVRFFMLVLIEPMLNPLKLPITFLAAKLYYALGPAFGLLPSLIHPPYAEYIGTFSAYLIALGIVNLLPSVGGFLGWEMRENWGLYRSNRSKNLGPLAVGAHGETVRGLLQPGFHSGTVPALYARLRLAERNATRTRNWSRVRIYRHEIEHVCALLKQFVEREMLALLRTSPSWASTPVEAGDVSLATNRFTVSLLHPEHTSRPVRLEIQHHHGRLTARIRDAGWLNELSPAQLPAFKTCLAGFYKRCDVDLVREQVVSSLTEPPASLEFASGAIFVRTGLYAEPRRYILNADDSASRSALNGMVFAWMPIAWTQWVQYWRDDIRNHTPKDLDAIGEKLLSSIHLRPD